MGIYIFVHEDLKWIKVGHTTYINPYNRLLEGGFNSSVCPEELKNKLYYNNVKLEYWFPNLEINVEREIHKKFKTTEENGEFYRIELLNI